MLKLHKILHTKLEEIKDLERLSCYGEIRELIIGTKQYYIQADKLHDLYDIFSELFNESLLKLRNSIFDEKDPCKNCLHVDCYPDDQTCWICGSGERSRWNN